MGSRISERVMQTEMPAVPQTRNLTGVSKPTRTAPDPLDLLEQFGTTVTVHRSHAIYRRGDPAELCWRIVDGCARAVTLMEDGRRQIDEFLWPGDLLGMDNLGVHDVHAEAVTGVTLRRYSRRMVEALAQSHVELALRLRVMAATKLRDARRQMVLLDRKTSMEKIASFLWDMDHRSTPTEKNRFVELPMKQGDIADHLGMSIETVSRLRAQLHHGGIVAALRSGVELRDRAALRILACESDF
jgi:CRP/FNR family transcriptional regulator, nitrogen fixation regulation protein